MFFNDLMNKQTKNQVHKIYEQYPEQTLLKWGMEHCIL